MDRGERRIFGDESRALIGGAGREFCLLAEDPYLQWPVEAAIKEGNYTYRRLSRPVSRENRVTAQSPGGRGAGRREPPVFCIFYTNRPMHAEVPVGRGKTGSDLVA